MPKLHIGLLLALLATSPLAAEPHLVKDLNRGPADPGAASLFETAAEGNVLYFTASDPAHGSELWRSDGTAAGTYRVTDVCPGRCSSFPNGIRALGGKVYFQADDGVSGIELWMSDGVPGHERRVRDLCPGPCGSAPQEMTAAGDRIVFFVRLGQRSQIWATDGTRAGTARIATLCIQPSECVSFGSLQSIGPRAFFEVYGSPAIAGLWETDGTAAGTFPVKNLVPGLPPPDSAPLPTAAGFAFFWSQDGLWRTDGTASGTFLVKAIGDLVPAATGVDRTSFHDLVAGGLLYTVLGSGDLIRSDGTAAGTFQLHKFTNGSAVTALAALPDRIVLAAGETPGPPSSVLWVSRGTPESTVPIADFSRTGFVDRIASFDHRAVFWVVPSAATAQADLWTTDGTAAGTALLAAGLPAATDPMQTLATDGQAFFLQPSPAVPGAEEANALWVTDGTPPRQVRDFGAGPGSGGPLAQTAFAGKLLFSARTSPSAAPLFVSDGSAAGTRQVSGEANFGEGFFPLGNKVLFKAGPALGQSSPGGLWKTDGTPAGTVPLLALNGFAAPKRLGPLVLFTGGVTMNPFGVDLELWKSDGTAKGTTVVDQINPYDVDTGFHHICVGASSNPGPGVLIGNRLLFPADDGVHGRELWSTDGTRRGTRLVADLNPLRSPDPPPMCDDEGPDGRTDSGLSSNPDGFARLGDGNVALFAADDGKTGRELWRTDGTARGTRRVSDLFPGPAGSSPHDLTRVGNLIYFFASPTGNGDALYRTDGTAKGTVLVSNLQLNGTPTWAKSLTLSGSQLYFVGYNELVGAELWTSDGTTAETRILADLNFGPASSSPQFLTDVGGVLLFAADDGQHGLELWRTDGTGKGTVRLGDLNPGPASSSPGPFTIVGDQVFFGADDGVHGRELWAIPVADVLRPFG